ncbi:hypothetical protein M0812_20831 [Anaeramoeba flamelloides]|nr:hypothetical protein M0812_20831 [Anaeramoeba flamelloides]
MLTNISPTVSQANRKKFQKKFLQIFLILFLIIYTLFDFLLEFEKSKNTTFQFFEYLGYFLPVLFAFYYIFKCRRVFPKSPNNKYYSDFRRMYYVVLVCVVLEFITLPLLAITLNLPKKMGNVWNSLFFLLLHLCDIFTIGLLVFYLFNKPTRNKGYNIQQDEEDSNLNTDTIRYMDESNSYSNSDY